MDEELARELLAIDLFRKEPTLVGGAQRMPPVLEAPIHEARPVDLVAHAEQKLKEWPEEAGVAREQIRRHGSCFEHMFHRVLGGKGQHLARELVERAVEQRVEHPGLRAEKVVRRGRADLGRLGQRDHRKIGAAPLANQAGSRVEDTPLAFGRLSFSE